VRKSIDASQAERARAEQQNRKMVAEENALKRIKDSHGKVARAYETVSGGLDRSRLVVDVVKQISDAVPAGGSVSLTQLAFERGVSVAIHGNAKSESAAMDLVLALQKTASLGEVRLAYLGDAQTDAGKGAGTNALVSKLKPGEKMSFIIACQWPKVTATRELVRPGTRVAGSRRRRGGTETGL
jgi:Tfp pilus assembly protein PilN